MKNVHTNIGILVRNHRIAKGISQMELAQKLGYNNPQFVSLFERGLSKIPLETLGQLVILLGIPENEVREMLINAAESEIFQRIKAGKKLAKVK